MNQAFSQPEGELSAPSGDRQTDVVVIGAGAAGLAAALAVHDQGLEVEMLEKAPQFGGTSALSGAAIWVPLHDGHKPADSSAAVLDYLGSLAPGDEARRQSFVASAAEALRFFQTETAVSYTSRELAPDYHMDRPGAVESGRVLDVDTYDGRRLGRRLADLRAPLETHLVFGGMMVNRADVQSLMKIGRGRKETLTSLALVGRYLRDRLTGWDRGTRLVVGSALVARLAESLFAAGIPLHLGAPAQRLLRGADGKVSGVEFTRDGQTYRLNSRLGVILASGGFPHSTERRRSELANPEAPHLSMASATSTGDGLSMAEAVGGTMGPVGAGAFFRAPISVHRPQHGAPRQFAHLTLDRAKPGVVAVNRNGQRFTNEADSYHRFGEALSRLPAAGPDQPVAWLICDATALRRYGLGLARPAPAHGGNRRLIRDRYLLTAPTLDQLAAKIDVPASALARSIADINVFAASGKDLQFYKGETTHNRSLGDPAVRPNPCLGPVATAPFYAIGLFSGDLGTARGLMTDADARVTDSAGAAIPGLYAIGNDMHSIMGGTYPGAGVTLGPALVFAWIAANAIAKDPT